MVLLGGEGVHNGLHHQPELLGEDGGVPSGFIILMGQVQGRAEGVHLIFPLPDPTALEIAEVVFAEPLLGRPVEGVGIGV